MATFEFTVNGQAKRVESDPKRPLLDVLREDIHLTGTKYGCGEGQCRACTVLVDNRPTLACLTTVDRVQQKELRTIEGLAKGDELHPVQEAFLEENAMQCGYCIPGMIMQTVALLEKTPHPTPEQTLTALNGSLCRCCGYQRILAAVDRAAAAMGGKPVESASVIHIQQAPGLTEEAAHARR